MLLFVRRNLKACSKSMKIEQKFTIILSNLTLNLLLKKVCMMHIKYVLSAIVLSSTIVSCVTIVRVQNVQNKITFTDAAK